ncbi:universal stress protein [Streptomyces tanashiensis]|uniref:universal stress protein n=1 Tax=Streptomyces tanashiensis TaxID=67367 RepID=UPI0036EC8029
MEAPVVAGPVTVGVDGSDAGLAALDWAVDEAVRHGCPLRIVHASLWERYEGVAPGRTEDRPSGEILAEDVVGTAAERARRRAPGLALTTEVIAEDAQSALLREGQDARLLVVGSRARGAIADALLGSVGLVVAARAHGPVVVVRGDLHSLEARHRRILLGVGDHEVDAPAVRFAFREAAVRDAELDVVSAWRRSGHEPVDPSLAAAEPGAAFAHRASELLDKALEPVARAYPGVRLRRTVVEGPAPRVLTERAAAADLLVVGARRRHRLVGPELGRVVHRALHHASCPVAVVPRHEPAPSSGDG